MKNKSFDLSRLLPYLGPSVALAVLFLLGFGFGGTQGGMIGYFVVFFILAVYFVLMAKAPLFGKNAENGLDLLYAIPLLVFCVFGSLNQFYGGTFGGIASGLLLLFGLLGAFLSGYFLRNKGIMKAKYAVYAVLAGLALLVFVNLVANLASYPLFYSYNFGNYVYFYEGIPHLIGNESQFLYGFGLMPMSMDYAVFPAIVLSSGLGMLFYIDPKKNDLKSHGLYEFIAVAVFGAIGWLFLVSMVEIKGMVLSLLIIAASAFYRFAKLSKKPSKAAVGTFLAVVGILIAFFLFVIANAVFEPSFLQEGFLGKIFNSGYLLPINQTISTLFNGGTYRDATAGQVILSILFGASSEGTTTYGVTSPISVLDISNFAFEFQVLLEGGFLAFIGLVLLVLFSVRTIRRNMVEGKEDPGKAGISILLVAILLTATFYYDSLPFAVTRYSSSAYLSPLQNSVYPLIALFLLGFVYQRNDVEEKDIEEEEPEEEIKEDGSDVLEVQ